MLWRKVLIEQDRSILEALKIIDEGALQVALIVDEGCRLRGVVTDGDIRRGILKGVALQEPVATIMNAHPTIAKITDSRIAIMELMTLRQLRHMPIVDGDGRVVGLHTRDTEATEVLDNWVILMAGGLGTRLRPLTEHCPKPLLNVGGRPLLETILESFMSSGFRKFYISVNYLSEMIENYFGDGSRWNAEIRYIRENERMGTAGALGLLEETPTAPFFVMNGDILTKVSFAQLLAFHNEQGSVATMCVRDHVLQVPYGVVDVENNKLLGIREKPNYSFFVNAGIYLLSPEVLRYVPPKQFFDMPDLFQAVMNNGLGTTAFPLREYWMDIGQIADYEKANHEFKEVFA